MFAVIPSLLISYHRTPVIRYAPRFLRGVREETEELPHGLSGRLPVALRCLLPQEDDGAMEELLLQGQGERLDALPVAIRQAGEQPGYAGELAVPDLVRDLARFHVALGVVLGGLELRQPPQRPGRKPPAQAPTPLRRARALKRTCPTGTSAK